MDGYSLDRLWEYVGSPAADWRELELVEEVRGYWDDYGTATELGRRLADKYPFVYHRWMNGSPGPY
jgi:hypothetical protein